MKKRIKSLLLGLPCFGSTKTQRLFINASPRPDKGPNLFVRRLSQFLTDKGVSVRYLGLRGCQSALLISSSYGTPFYTWAKKLRVRTVLRMDGFYPSVYFDNRPTPPGAQSRALTPEKAAFNLQLKEDIQRVDHVIYQSQWVKTLADQYLAPRTKAFSVVYNGVNMDTFKPLPQKRKKMHLLTAGHIRHEYMLNTILPIFLKLKKEFSLGLIVAGPMDVINRQTFEQARNQHPREFEDVIYLGPISHARLPSVYQQGDVFIHPRAGDGCPNVVVEALASGLPVVCPKWGGTAELIGKGGIAVEAGAWDYSQAFIDGMTNATYKVLQNLDPFKKEARLQAVTHLDEKTMGRKYQEILFA